MKITDLFGNERDITRISGDEPTEAWIQGWETYMYKGLSDNPYHPDDSEYQDWQDGYYAAERG